jgi:hypothetical protein
MSDNRSSSTAESRQPSGVLTTSTAPDSWRARADSDRRRNLVRLTPPGAEALERLAASVEDAQAVLLAPLPAAEHRQLRPLLTRLVEYHGERQH